MMKKIKLYLLVILAAISIEGFAQSVNINVNMSPPSIEKGATGYIEVNICNIDISPITVPANKLRPTITVPGNVMITGVTDTNGDPLAGFIVQSLSTGSGNSIRLLATRELQNFECFDFHITVVGVNVGVTDIITGTLGFQGPPPVNDSPSDNNSTTGVAVTAVLPVTLTSFTAQKESSTTFLKWQTTSETNSDRFEVQRSQNGKNWEKIGTVASNGESASLKNYSFTDPKPVTGENLYRLRMVDKDETFAYSRIRSVTFENLIQTFTYPNPATDKLLLKDFAEVKRVMLHNMSGVKMFDIEKVTSDGIDIKHLIPGMYIVSVTLSDGALYADKIVISR